MATQSDQVILFREELPRKRETERLFITTGTQHGEPFIDIRVFFKPVFPKDDDDQWRPTKKGVYLHAEFGPDLVSILQRGVEAIDNAH